MYEKYTSLGLNCEVSFVLERLGFDQANEYFAWTYGSARAVGSLIDAGFASNCEDGRLKPIVGGAMILDTLYNIQYHSAFQHDGQDEFQGPRHERIYRIFKALIDKKAAIFQAELQSVGSPVYIAKYDGDLPREDAIALRNVIERHRDGDFVLVFVQEERRRESSWDERRIANRYVTRFSPPERADDIDHHAWQRVLREFPVRASPTLKTQRPLSWEATRINLGEA